MTRKPKTKKRDISPPPSKRAAKEMEVDTICTDLKELKYSEL